MHKLKNLCTLITDGEHGSVKDDPNGNCFLLSNKNIYDGRIVINDNERKISIVTKERLNKRTKLSKDTILISTVGTIGKLAFINSDDINYSFQRSVGIIHTNAEILDPYFLYCLLQTNFYQTKMRQMSSGSVQKCLFISNIEDLDILDIEINKQKKISSTIKKIDDLINENNLLINTLSNKIKDLYSYYFHSFKGNKDVVYSEKVGLNVPKNFKIIPLLDFVKFSKGFEPSSSAYKEDPLDKHSFIKFYRVGDMDDTGKTYIKENLAINKCKEDDVLISLDGAIGNVSFGLNGCYSSGLYKVENNCGFSNAINFAIANDKRIISLLKNGSKSNSIIKHASGLIKYVYIPFDEEYYRNFDCIIRPLFEMMVAKRVESKKLKDYKDFILTTSINGLLNFN